MTDLRRSGSGNAEGRPRGAGKQLTKAEQEAD
jgi:hypothetical protein